jgi:hypothetical protein
MTQTSAEASSAKPALVLWTDFRDVPLEVLRDFARTWAEDTFIRQVAAEIGMGRTTLHSFINGETTPHPRIRRRIALCYLAWLQTPPPDMDLVRPFVAALDVLIAGLPEHRREATITILLEGLESGYAGDDAPPPRWLEALRAVIQRRMASR